jgi:hypothetical protein
MASISAIFADFTGLPAAVRRMQMEPLRFFALDCVNPVNSNTNFRRLALRSAPEHRRVRVSPQPSGKAVRP